MKPADTVKTLRRFGVSAELRDGAIVMSEFDLGVVAERLEATSRELGDLRRAVKVEPALLKADLRPAELRQALKFQRRRADWLTRKIAGLTPGTPAHGASKGELDSVTLSIALIETALAGHKET
jgi:hypothetical protein